METKSLLCLVLAFTGSLSLPMVQDHNLLGLDSNDKNHDDIVKITKFVRDNLAVDVQANRNFSKQNNEKTEAIAKAIIQHVNDLNTDTTKTFEETLQNLQNAIEENMKFIVDQTAANHNALETRSKNNEEKILTETENHFEALLTKIKARLAQHESMLDTHVAICANRFKNVPQGKVTYEDTSMDSIIVGGKPMARNDVLDVSRGEFIAPVPGTYQISFTAIIDTLNDLTEELAQAKFVFSQTQPTGGLRWLESTSLTATAGRPGGDKVPASRSVLLDLRAGEAVAIHQVNHGAESTYRLTFCAHLIRPTAPTAPWQPLPSMTAPQLEVDTTYTEPEQKPFTLGDLTMSREDPAVSMPLPEAELLFPKTDFFRKISGSLATGTSSDVDPITYLDTSRNEDM